MPRRVQEQHLQVQSAIRVERDSGGRTSHVDMELRARVMISLEFDNGSVRGSGVVDSFFLHGVDRLTSPRSAGAVPGPLRVPFDFTADSVQVRVAVRPPLDNECDRPETGATGLIRDLIVRLPREVSVGATWADSSVSFLCRSAVPMTVRTRNRYTVDRAEVRGADTVLRVIRTHESSVEGTSTAAWRTRTVRGTGSGAQQLVVSVRTGGVVELEGRNSLILQTGVERITQTVEMRVRALP